MEVSAHNQLTLKQDGMAKGMAEEKKAMAAQAVPASSRQEEGYIHKHSYICIFRPHPQ